MVAIQASYGANPAAFVGGISQMQVRSVVNVWTDVGYAVGNLPVPTLIQNLGGAAAVNIQDGGNSITVDGTVIATQGGVWTVGATQSGAWLVAIPVPVPVTDNGGSLTVDFTVPVPVTDNGGSLTVDGTVTANQGGAWTVTADTELPAAAALADNMANPTTPLIGACVMGYDGANWDRIRGDSVNGLETYNSNTAGAGAVNIQDGGNSITVDGTVTANQGGAPWSVTIPVPVPVTDNAGSLTVDQPTHANLNATIRIQDGNGALLADVAASNTIHPLTDNALRTTSLGYMYWVSGGQLCAFTADNYALGAVSVLGAGLPLLVGNAEPANAWTARNSQTFAVCTASCVRILANPQCTPGRPQIYLANPALSARYIHISHIRIAGVKSQSMIGNITAPLYMVQVEKNVALTMGGAAVVPTPLGATTTASVLTALDNTVLIQVVPSGLITHRGQMVLRPISSVSYPVGLLIEQADWETHADDNNLLVIAPGQNIAIQVYQEPVMGGVDEELLEIVYEIHYHEKF